MAADETNIHQEDLPRQSTRLRRVNGALSAVILVFFCVHGALGSAALAMGYVSPLAWIAWIGVGLVVVHIIMCVATSYQQLTDTVRPPSVQKRRHLLWKWLTGALLAVCAGIHAASAWIFGAHASQTTVTGAVLTFAVAVLLGAHLCFGVKSLLKDLGIDRRYRIVLRAVIIVLAAAFAVTALAKASALL